MKNTIITISMLLCLGGFLSITPAHAQNIIRDAEIESSLRTISTPIFNASGLNPAQVRIVVINEDVINAFVAGGQNLFLYTGLILEAENVGELAGVIAHESGHMAGGHLVRMRGAAERASVEAILATVLGVAVGVGAGDSQVGVATVLGGSEYANRSLLRHSRVLESSADQAGLAALQRTGYSAKGMASFLERLSAQEVLPEMQRSGYVLTHPLSRERMQTVESFVANHPNAKPFPAAWQDQFKRLQAKILAFTQPQQALRKYASDPSVAGKYATAIANYRTGKINEALTLLSGLEKSEPNNAWFKELRGQILFEQGRIPEAITAYRSATVLAPKAGLVHLALAQALLQDESKVPQEALTQLTLARDNGEEDSQQLYRWFAVAYGRQGKEGLAKLNLAEEALLKQDYQFALDQANRAEKLLDADPAAKQRARDIQSRAFRLQKDKKK
jgi:predicted Zn-dependent protease